MTWKAALNDDPLPWLLEERNPGVRYLALRNLVQVPEDDKTLILARRLAHQEGPIATILDHMQPGGFWEKPGPGYLPKYRSIVWSIINLAQLGAHVKEDPRIVTACSYLLDHALTDGGQFSTNGPPSGTADCLQGNMLASLMDLGFEDPRMDSALDWMARTVTGEGIAPPTDRSAPRRYYAGKYGPGFVCGANNKLPCAWGAVKVMLALGKMSNRGKKAIVTPAVDTGLSFLFSIDPATAAYPCGYSDKPSRNWWKFGFPVFYVTDILQLVEALALHGCGKDPRLKNALDLILEKQDKDGRWKMEYSYDGKTWVSYGANKTTSKWVTLRALSTLQLAMNDGSAITDC